MSRALATEADHAENYILLHSIPPIPRRGSASFQIEGGACGSKNDKKTSMTKAGRRDRCFAEGGRPHSRVLKCATVAVLTLVRRLEKISSIVTDHGASEKVISFGNPMQNLKVS